MLASFYRLSLQLMMHSLFNADNTHEKTESIIKTVPQYISSEFNLHITFAIPSISLSYLSLTSFWKHFSNLYL